jgi:anti-anti-sigma factor
MSVRCDQYNRVCVLGVEGELSGANCQNLRRIAQEQIDNRQLLEFVIDFEKCPFIDSEGLESLLWLKRRCEESFGQVKLANADDNCRKILEITRLRRRFECFEDLTAAVKTMR